MTVKECYAEIGGDYEDIMSRLRTEERIVRFLKKAAEDKSFELLERSVAERNVEEAFRAVHTLKGICLNLSLTALLESSVNLTEALRGRTEFGEDVEALFEKLKADYVKTVGCINKL